MGLSLRTWIVGAAAAAGLGALAWLAMTPEPVPVDLAPVTRGPMEVTVNADGTTRIRDVFEVSAPVTGRALRSPVEVGEAVIAGETVVAVVQPGEPAFLDIRSRSQAEAAVKEAEAALKLAETAIAKAEADLRYSESQLERVRGLYDRGAVPRSQLDDAVLSRDIALAQYDSALAARDMRESELDRQRAMLIEPNAMPLDRMAEECCVRITAPVSGRVLDVVNESARTVQAGAPLLTVGRLDDLEIVVDLLSSDAVRVAPGARAHVERWGGAGTLEAALREIEPAAFTKVSALGIEEQRVRALLDFTTPPEERAALGHNYRVYVRIVEWAADNVLRVPIGALFRADADWAVFVAADDTARLRRIEIGQRNGDWAELRAGLDAGERVVLHPSDRVADGAAIVDRAALD
jgi:HlyD family secretion protein